MAERDVQSNMTPAEIAVWESVARKGRLPAMFQQLGPTGWRKWLESAAEKVQEGSR